MQSRPMNANPRASTFLTALFLGLLSIAGVGDSPAQESAVRPAPTRFQHFITRQGNKLYDGDREFRFIGGEHAGTGVALRLDALPAGAGSIWPHRGNRRMRSRRSTR